MLFDELKQQESFNNTEKMIATYILNHPRDFVFASIEAIAKKTFSSPATVVRFSKKLGFSGFTEFKIKVASELNTFLNPKSRIEVDMPILPNSDIETTLHNFYLLSTQVLEDAYNLLNRNDIEKVAKMLHEAEIIHILGSGPSALIGLDLHYKLRRIGYNSVCDAVTGFQIQHLNRSNKKEVALIVSTYARSDQIHQWINHLELMGTPIILVTTNLQSPLLERVSRSVVVNQSENQVWKMGSFASRTVLTYALDCIYATMFNFDYIRNTKMLYDTGTRFGDIRDELDSEMMALIKTYKQEK